MNLTPPCHSAALPGRARSWLLVLAALAAWPAHGELYRYVNDDGVTVLDNRVPPEYARNGYTVLSDTGKVLEVVPRQLSEAELAAFKQQQQDEADRQKALEEQEEADEQLLRIYSSPNDVIRVRDTKLHGVETAISSAQEKLKRLMDRRRELEADLANIERNGGTISESRMKTMENLTKSIARTEADIAKGHKEHEQLTAQYAAEHARMEALVGSGPSS